MFHSRRLWCVNSVASAEELARKLTETTWCCCTAFELGGYLWLNDSTSPDGAQEFAIVKKLGPSGKPVQLESITFGWCDQVKAQAYILLTLAGKDDQNDFRREVEPVLQSPAEHVRCPHCS
jgi:hypothetical protein